MKSISMKKYIHKSTEKGFTILETLVAITILVVSLTAPLTIVSQALRSSYYARDQVTAYFLAQEAVEFLRNKRDSVGLQRSTPSENWIDTFNAYTTPTGLTVEDIINESGSTLLKSYLIRDSSAEGGYRLVKCNPTCPAVSYDPSSTSGVLYGSNNYTDESIFVREITVSKSVLGLNGTGGVGDPEKSEDSVTRPPSRRELVVNVRVRWRTQDGSLSDGVTVIDHLTNWQLEKSI